VSRVQLALNVSDLDEAVAFYSTLFATVPAKVRPGYANFAVADPPLKLVLIETAEVSAAQARLDSTGLPTTTETASECCYALQDKVWVDGPGGEPWEIYTVLADADTPPGGRGGGDPAGAACCAPEPVAIGIPSSVAGEAAGPAACC
jgi:catechol 2,3-dioxygenase-like lactoylglutathione lyase family enzyme